jgi:CMP-N-acetylneuraminic acid synthetase
MSKRIVAIIPARGGSKRLPKKNILHLDGKPLLGHTIEHAFQSKIFTDVIVSTENSEIAEIGKDFGARIHKRSPRLSSDQARVRDVCISVIEDCFQPPLNVVDSFCVLTATSALRNAHDIRKSYQIFKEGCDFVISVTDYFFYPHAALILNENGEPVYYWPEIALKKGQEVPSLFVENGAINWCRTHAFMKHKELLGPNARAYFMPKHRSIDLDTKEDFFVLEAIYSKKRMTS